MQLLTAEGNLKFVMNLKPEGGIIEADNTRFSVIQFVKDLTNMHFCGFLCSVFNKNLYARLQKFNTFNC